jgi:hypothetical protein
MVINDIRSHKIPIRIDYIDTFETKYNKITKVQRNTTPRIPSNSFLNVQMLALVKIIDFKLDVETYVLGFSKKYNTPFTNYKKNLMRDQCIEFAKKKYVARYVSRDPKVTYKDVSPYPEIYGEIVQERYQYVRTIRKKRK